MDAFPVADESFVHTFMPYEVLLAQRRAMVGSPAFPGAPSGFIGLYLIRLEPAPGHWFPAALEGGSQLSEQVVSMLRTAIRESDIPIRMSDQEHLAVLRDIDPQHAYVVAQRFLSAAGKSELFRAAGLRTRVGYIVYPLSTQPNFPATEWTTLVDLARRMARRGEPDEGPAAGHGLLRGAQMEATGIPETDLVPLAFQDPESLVKAGILQIQRIHVLPGL